MGAAYDILIADDELLCRQAVRLALPQTGCNYNIIEAADGGDAIAKMAQHKPQIIFLDIQMPLLTGIEVLRSLPGNYAPYIIIVSGHAEFALPAYEHDAADYLLKPFSQARFDKAFQKAWFRVTSGGQAGAVASLSERMEQMLGKPAFKTRLSIRDGHKILVVPCADITHISAEGEYAAVHTAARKYLHNESLGALEAALDPGVFARIHRSSIVNIGFIKELVSQFNGDYSVVLHGGAELKMSRNYREKVLQLIG